MKKGIITLGQLMIISYAVYSQTALGNIEIDFTPFTSINIVPNTPKQITFTAPTIAGLPLIAPPVAKGIWLNYTSAMNSNLPPRSIIAQCNEIIPGVDIKISASNTTTGKGIRGTTSGTQNLNTYGVTILTGIKASYTGSGTTKGHEISITLEPNDYSKIIHLNQRSIIITYTISE